MKYFRPNTIFKCQNPNFIRFVAISELFIPFHFYIVSLFPRHHARPSIKGQQLASWMYGTHIHCISNSPYTRTYTCTYIIQVTFSQYTYLLVGTWLHYMT